MHSLGVASEPDSTTERPTEDATAAALEADETAVIDQAAASEAESKAIGVALETGDDQEWTGGGVSGRIKVKDVERSDQSVCRKYRAERDGVKSGYSTVCKDNSGGWVAD